MNISPEALRSAPKSALIISVLPAPISPANPKTSPFLREKLTSLIIGGRERLRTSKTTFPALTPTLGTTLTSLPTINFITSLILVSSQESSPTLWPSLNTTILSATEKTSSNL